MIDRQSARYVLLTRRYREHRVFFDKTPCSLRPCMSTRHSCVIQRRFVGPPTGPPPWGRETGGERNCRKVYHTPSRLQPHWRLREGHSRFVEWRREHRPCGQGWNPYPDALNASQRGTSSPPCRRHRRQPSQTFVFPRVSADISVICVLQATFLQFFECSRLRSLPRQRHAKRGGWNPACEGGSCVFQSMPEFATFHHPLIPLSGWIHVLPYNDRCILLKQKCPTEFGRTLWGVSGLRQDNCQQSYCIRQRMPSPKEARRGGRPSPGHRADPPQSGGSRPRQSWRRCRCRIPAAGCVPAAVSAGRFPDAGGG